MNLGLEGTLFMGAMTAYAVSYHCGQSSSSFMLALAPWLGVLAASAVGTLLGAMHAVICNLPRVNSVTVGIGMMIFGVGLAKYLGKPYIQPQAPNLPSIDFGAWSSSSQIHSALKINALFFIGVVLAPLMASGC